MKDKPRAYVIYRNKNDWALKLEARSKAYVVGNKAYCSRVALDLLFKKTVSQIFVHKPDGTVERIIKEMPIG